MARVLVLTTDLPFFPGRNGHDYFNLAYLAKSRGVAVVAPIYDWFPLVGVRNLEAVVDLSYCWPRVVATEEACTGSLFEKLSRSWIDKLPGRFRRWILLRLVNLDDRPGDAYGKLSILVNCAPHILTALVRNEFNAIVLIQSSLEPWLDYLPAVGAKLVYFHDVRSDYLGKRRQVSGTQAVSKRELRAIAGQEGRVFDRIDLAGFVSDLDMDRARRRFKSQTDAGVAPIPVDTTYYSPRPSNWVREPRLVVLFTGHLSHPPNEDAVFYFLEEIWPRILEFQPSAVFQAVGMMPGPMLADAIASATNCELHANVADIRPYFWNASVYVVPMRFGGGVRQKIFEAWSMRVPVVCTTMAAEGIKASLEERFLSANTAVDFAHRVVDVLSESVDLEPIVTAASGFVRSHHAIDAAAPEFQRLVTWAIARRRQRPIKLLFDLRWMEIGKAGGIEQATYELVSAISLLDQQNSYRIYGPRSTCTEWRFPAGFNLVTHYSDPAEQRLDTIKSSVANRLATSLGLQPIMSRPMRALARYRRFDFDIVHSVCGYTHPDLIGFPGVLTINDLQHLHYPEFFSPEEYAEREKLYRDSAQRARHIICISEFTRRDVHNRYGVPLDKMSTIWLIPSRNVWDQLRPATLNSVLLSMGLSGRFFLYPAHCWPHKNHERLLDAFSRIVSELPSDMQLVLTGREFPADHPAAILIRERKLERRVIHLGFRSPLEMKGLFQGCLALVFPSLFEGFGMPIAEAMIAARPVICSNVTSLPEIAGDAALTFDPLDVEDMAKKMLQISRDGDLHNQLSDASRQRRTQFSSRPIAIESLAVYRRVFHEIYGD